MTKTITIPISSETCHKIKLLTAWFTLLGLVAGLLYGVIYTTINIINNESYIHSIVVLIFCGAVLLCSIWAILEYLKENGHWVQFKCNCDKNTKI